MHGALLSHHLIHFHIIAHSHECKVTFTYIVNALWRVLKAIKLSIWNSKLLLIVVMKVICGKTVMYYGGPVHTHTYICIACMNRNERYTAKDVRVVAFETSIPFTIYPVLHYARSNARERNIPYLGCHTICAVLLTSSLWNPTCNCTASPALSVWISVCWISHLLLFLWRPVCDLTEVYCWFKSSCVGIVEEGERETRDQHQLCKSFVN